MKIVSWNVNGIRAILKKNFIEFVSKENPDILISVLRSNINFSHTALLWPGSKIVLAVAICNKTMKVEIQITYNHVYFDGNDMLELAESMAF